MEEDCFAPADIGAKRDHPAEQKASSISFRRTSISFKAPSTEQKASSTEFRASSIS